MSAERMFKGDGPLAVAEQAAIMEADALARYDEYPKEPDFVKSLPLATHRISSERAVCDGDAGSRCHWYPDCGEHEQWPCGCAYVAHDECWMIPWLDATSLDDSACDDDWSRRDPETLAWPDGEIDIEWEVDWVTWKYDTKPEEEKNDGND